MTEEVKTQKKDKQKVTEEVFTLDMLKHFLKDPVPSEDSQDFRRLLFAYRGMPVEAFEQYLSLYIENGFDLKAKDSQGRTFLEYIDNFAAQRAYADLLRAQLSE